MKTIIVTGTPGAGKTSVAKRIAKQMKCEYFDVTAFIKKKKLYDFYDRKSKSYVVDTKKLNKELVKIAKKGNVVIDSHLSHYLPSKVVDLCVVAKCELKELKKRLEKRGYSEAKVRENLDCEIFDICLNEAKEAGHDVVVVDCSKKVKNNKK
jgi:adenylate kinase